MELFWVSGIVGFIVLFLLYKNLKKETEELEMPEEVEEFKGYCVYAIYNSRNRKVYIGMTGSYEKRKAQHFDAHQRSLESWKFLYQGMEQIGANKFTMVRLFSGLTEKEAKYAEAKLINGWSTLKPYGYNVAEEQDSRQLGFHVAVDKRFIYDAVQELCHFDNKMRIRNPDWKDYRAFKESVRKGGIIDGTNETQTTQVSKQSNA
jgi:hypothetical protein